MQASTWSPAFLGFNALLGGVALGWLPALPVWITVHRRRREQAKRDQDAWWAVIEERSG